jgi:hypothetical protein
MKSGLLHAISERERKYSVTSLISRGGWYSDTSLFQGLVVHVVFEDESGMNAKEVARGKSQRVVTLFQRNRGPKFFPPSVPPRRAERGGGLNCRQAVVMVDASHRFDGCLRKRYWERFPVTVW